MRVQIAGSTSLPAGERRASVCHHFPSPVGEEVTNDLMRAEVMNHDSDPVPLPGRRAGMWVFTGAPLCLEPATVSSWWILEKAVRTL